MTNYAQNGIIFDVRFKDDSVFQRLALQFQSETIVSKPLLIRRKLPNNPGCTLEYRSQVNALTIFAWFAFKNILCPHPLFLPTQSTSSIFVNFAAKDKTLPYDITRYNDITK